MNFLYGVFDTLLKAGPTVLLPIIITVIGLIFRVPLSRAFRSGLTIAIGFIGIKLVINLLSSNLGPAAKAMVENFGIKLDTIDVGWGAISAVTWSSPIIAILIFAILITNIVMLILKATDTLDVDIWNYHHLAIVGIMVFEVTHNIVYAILASIVMAIITFKLSDWTAPLVEDYFGLPGVSLPTMSALSSVIIAAPLNALLDKIPGISKIDFSVKDAKKYLEGTDVKVAAVVGFPLGAMTTAAKVFEARRAIEDGASEIDMVINIGALKDGEYDYVENEIREIKETIGNNVLKVIIETCYLTDDEKKKACELSLNAKADFVKTSTGFGTGGATFEDVELMKSVVGDKAQVKASGGVKDLETAKKYIELGATRLGTSSGIAIVTGLESEKAGY